MSKKSNLKNQQKKLKKVLTKRIKFDILETQLEKEAKMFFEN